MKIPQLLLVKLKINFHRYKTNESIKLHMLRYPQLSNWKQFAFSQLSRAVETETSQSQQIRKFSRTLLYFESSQSRLDKKFLSKQIFATILETPFPRKKQINRTNFSQQD